MTLKDAYTTQELMDILKTDIRTTVLRRAKRESWQSRPRAGRGGGSEWLVASMPEATRLLIASRVCVTAPPPISPEQQSGLAAVVTLTGKGKARAEARVNVISLYRAFTVNSGLAPTPAARAFVTRWNAGAIAAEVWVREFLPTLCCNSLLNWNKAVKTEGAARLAGNYGTHLKGKGCIDAQPELRDAVLGMFAEHPHASAQLIFEKLQALNWKREHPEHSEELPLPALKLPSLRRLQQWIGNWKSTNPQLELFVRAPDAWRGRFLASCGDMYELITRYNQRWEFDGTPSDIMLSDNQRYTILGVINIYDRALKLEVVPRSTAGAVAELFRRALMDWGVPEEAVTDNGKEFVSTHVQQLTTSLNILSTILPPFRPDLKPAIERAFRSFSHHLLTLFPCYLGHNVATRQEIRERETFAKRLFSKDEPISMAISPEKLQEFCNDWTNAVYAHRPHSGLKGRTPYAVRHAWEGEIRRVADERALDVLLTPLADNNGFRTVAKKGIRTGNGRYDHATLGVFVGKQVQVRMNRSERDFAYIFSEDGEFLCKASKMEELSSEARRDMAVAKKSTQRAYVNAGARELRRMAKRTDAEHAADDIMTYHKARAAKIEEQALANTTGSMAEIVLHTTPALEQAGLAARAYASKAPLHHNEAVCAARKAARMELDVVESWLPDRPRTRFALYKDLKAQALRGGAIQSEKHDWMLAYGDSNECQGFMEMESMYAPRAVNE